MQIPWPVLAYSNTFCVVFNEENVKVRHGKDVLIAGHRKVNGNILLDLIALKSLIIIHMMYYFQINCTDIAGDLRTVWGCNEYYIDELDGCIKLEIILHSDSYDPRQIRQISYSITTPEGMIFMQPFVN